MPNHNRQSRTLRQRNMVTPVAIAALVTLVSSACAVAVHDRRADKVQVCHKGKKTLSVAAAALEAHLNHGDYRGPCR